MRFAIHDLTHLLATYGYGAVLFFVAIESIGIPFLGETMRLAAAIYAGTTHHLFIPFVIAAVAAPRSWAATSASGSAARAATACCGVTAHTSASTSAR